MTPPPTSDPSDIAADGWLDRLAPDFGRPYLRLARFDRPIGWWLLLLPCWWSTALATPNWPSGLMLLLFLAGAIVMRGAGCTLNDIVDRRFDAAVARTATRPIPSGQVSVRQATVWLLALSLVGLVILLQFNGTTILLGIASLTLVAAYPFMKRITWWPQAWLGLTFNYGALLGWTAVHGALAWPALMLYGAGIAWTLGYDTIYAHQDKDDDALIGVKSTALRLGDKTKSWLVMFYAVSIALLGLAGAMVGIGWPFWTGLALAALHFAWQLKTVNLDDPRRCLAVFKSNRDVGLIIFAALVAGQVVG